jgi:hypothetical protein
MVTRYLNETEDAPTKIVKVIGDVRNAHLHRHRWLGAVRRAALRKAKQVIRDEARRTRPTAKLLSRSRSLSSDKSTQK